jgi:asparagine N-glycosylation enzyme membrane subunit Stt3
MSKRAIFFAAAGLTVALLWAPLVSNLIPLFPVATSSMSWRAIQFLVGFASAVVLVLPIAIAARPVHFRHEATLGVVFLVSLAVLHLGFGGTTETLLEMFQLPDIWAFLIASACFFWLAPARKSVPRAA